MTDRKILSATADPYHALLEKTFGEPTKSNRADYMRAVKHMGGCPFRPRTRDGLLIGQPSLILPRTRELTIEGRKSLLGHRTKAADASADPMTLGHFAGYGSVYGVLDSYDEIIEQGAFDETLIDDAATQKSLWQHRSSRPLGLPTIREADDVGLWWDSPIIDLSWGVDAWRAVKSGLVAGLSIGYYLTKYYWDEEGSEESKGWPILHIVGVRLLEVSVVTWGANPAALIEEVRAALAAGNDDAEKSAPAPTKAPLNPLAKLLEDGISALACDALPRADILQTLADHLGREDIAQLLSGAAKAAAEELVEIASILGIDPDEVLEASAA